jgi:hypothetical protein
MTTLNIVLITLSPLILLITAYTAVVIVALCKADSADVPTIMKDSVKVFVDLIAKLPTSRPTWEDQPEFDGGEKQDQVEEVR